MATVPKVKVTFDADLDGLKRGTAQAEGELDGFGKTVEKFGAAAKAAFAAAAAAAAAYAVKLGVDGVKAAIEDEQAQSRLARTLEAAAGATKEQIAATETFISKMQLATGVSDTQLRSAMGRLTLSTNDVTKSQELLSLALDISKATGKDLDGVANALGKAYDGQTTALGKLGIGLSSAELKTMTFKDTQTRLSDLFGGAAARNAETFQGKLDIMKQRFGEFQETVGNKAIPVLLNLFNLFDQKITPAFEWFKKNAIDPVADAIERNKDSFEAFGKLIATYVVPILTGAFMVAIKGIATAFTVVLDVIGKVADGIVAVVNGAIGAINTLIKAYNAIPFLPNAPTIPTVSAPKISVPSATTPKISVPSTPSVPAAPSSSGGSGASGAATSVAAAAAGLSAAELAAIPRTGSAAGTAGAAFLAANPSVVINVNAPSVIDEAGFTQSVIQAFNNGTYRGTAGAGMLAGLSG